MMADMKGSSNVDETLSFDVLDHGRLTLVQAWGSDEMVIESARMSTGKGFLGWGPVHSKDCVDEKPAWPKTERQDCCKGQPGDEKLLAYLWEHAHHTPFEMCGLTVEVQAPIFVFREWHRHRTQSYNELSARYTPIPDVNYVPTVKRCMLNAGTNKQAQGTGAALTAEAAQQWLEQELTEIYREAQTAYEVGLSLGVPKEIARLVLPVGRYSRMRASGNLRNWLAFYKLRAAPDAQWEIRQYADCIGKLIADTFPRVWSVVNAEA